MKPLPHPFGAPVPINKIKVKLKPKPHTQRWEIKGLLGIENFDHLLRDWDKKLMAKTVHRPWDRFDIMKTYRSEITEEDQKEIFDEMVENQQNFQVQLGRRHKIFSHRRSFLVKDSSS